MTIRISTPRPAAQPERRPRKGAPQTRLARSALGSPGAPQRPIVDPKPSRLPRMTQPRPSHPHAERAGDAAGAYLQPTTGAHTLPPAQPPLLNPAANLSGNRVLNRVVNHAANHDATRSASHNLRHATKRVGSPTANQPLTRRRTRAGMGGRYTGTPHLRAMKPRWNGSLVRHPKARIATIARSIGPTDRNARIDALTVVLTSDRNAPSRMIVVIVAGGGGAAVAMSVAATMIETRSATRIVGRAVNARPSGSASGLPASSRVVAGRIASTHRNAVGRAEMVGVAATGFGVAVKAGASMVVRMEHPTQPARRRRRSP